MLPVSYTHLSYYFNREWIKKYLGMNMLRLEASTRDFINWNSIRQERGLSYPKSVSYTHLDVYKRQQLMCALIPAIAPCPPASS